MFIEGSTKIREKYKNMNMVNKMRDYVTDFVVSNPSSVVSSYLIQINARGYGYQWTKKTFESLSEEQKNSLQGLDIQKTLSQHNLMKIGNTIADLSQKDIHDSVFHLSSLRGNYVLLDFWASWCGPCRHENPNVKKVYEKYHSQGFEIVGVSLDSDGNKWKEAVEKDGLTWIQLSDLKGWNNVIASVFEINSIPTNILINKEGKIIATNLSGSELEKAVKRCFNNKD
jgi:thiol-disulfide isomerase/thioredoxin